VLQDKIASGRNSLRKWSTAEDSQLRELMLPYTGRRADWVEVASTIAYWTLRQCALHWHSAANPALKKGRSHPWTREEDDVILDGTRDGKSIAEIAKVLSRLPTAVTQRLFGCAGSANKGLNARLKRNNNGVEELSAKRSRSRNDVDDNRKPGPNPRREPGAVCLGDGRSTRSGWVPGSRCELCDSIWCV
jgi:hypothetical protein